MNSPYDVVAAPNYAAPIVDLFGNQGQQQKQPQQQGQQQNGQNVGQGLAALLRQFLTPQQGPLAPGSAVPGASGPTSVGGYNGPAPLMASGSAPFMNSQGMGLY